MNATVNMALSPLTTLVYDTPRIHPIFSCHLNWQYHLFLPWLSRITWHKLHWPYLFHVTQVRQKKLPNNWHKHFCISSSLAWNKSICFMSPRVPKAITANVTVTSIFFICPCLGYLTSHDMTHIGLLFVSCHLKARTANITVTNILKHS